jgi:hypothetical protein
VDVVVLGPPHGLLHDRVREPALYLHDNRLVLLVADDDALQYPLWHRAPLKPCFRRALLRSDRLDPGNVAAHLADARGLLQLPGRPLEAQVELLFLEIEELIGQLVRCLRPQVFSLIGISVTPRYA